MSATALSRRGARDRPAHHSTSATATIAAVTRARCSELASMGQSPEGSELDGSGRGAPDAGALAPRPPPPPLRRRRRRLRLASPARARPSRGGAAATTGTGAEPGAGTASTYVVAAGATGL